jgi:hypothetical protein
MVLETSVYTPFNHTSRLLAREYFLEKIFLLFNYLKTLIKFETKKALFYHRLTFVGIHCIE